MKASPFKIERSQRINELYRDFNFQAPLLNDPIQLVNRYQTAEEIELAAFISSTLAFGRIELFKPVIRKILEMGQGHLKQFVLDFNPSKDQKQFKNLYYRIWKEKDLICLVFALQQIIKKYGSLENLFLKLTNPDDDHFETAMIGFSEEFIRFNPSSVYGINQFPRSFKVFVPSPGSGSACKRFSLFLRWMVRKDDIDKGIWRSLSPAKLIIPLDTHIYRISRFLKLTRLKTPGWKMAKEITQSLKEIDPDDPLKFDFPLCHFSIQSRCLSGERSRLCDLCSIRKRCYFNGKNTSA
jgi:uncharacterized protein (TIGR02757 family)